MRQTWTADDGRTFNTKQACLDYEQSLLLLGQQREQRPRETPKNFVSHYKRSTASRLPEIRSRREAGESYDAIAADLGVSRQRVHQLCTENGIKGPTDRPAEEKVADVVALLKAGKSREAACREAGLSSATLRKYAEELGVDLEAAVKEGQTHRYDGREFGWWTVVPGTYAYEKGNSNGRSVECQCKCGIKRRVNIGNLLNGVSRGCGCRSKKASAGRKRTPWVCEETGEREPNTQALSRRLGINPIILYRRANRNEPLVINGLTWKPLADEAVDHFCGSREKWVELATGKLFDSGAAVAREGGSHPTTPSLAVRNGKAYRSPDGRFFTPVSQQDLPQELPANGGHHPVPWTCSRTGEVWKSLRDLAEHLQISAETLRRHRLRHGKYTAPDGREFKPVPPAHGSNG